MSDVKRADHSLFGLEHTFARELPELGVPWKAAPVPSPGLLALNEELVRELQLDAEALRTADGIAVLLGQGLPDDVPTVAQAYSGHQFGNYSPRLGDGRALLLGEITDVHGRTRDLHVKGSGRTPFARGGDGRAAVGPMLREFVISEAMHALGIPTTRALAVVATGEHVVRERTLPGAVLARVAASHLRVGTFQYTTATGDTALLARLVRFAAQRHHPHVLTADNPALALLDAVIGAQASLIAKWMTVGFVHGVMNTDNMTISGETIDYGPCAFMDRHDPQTVFSSIDQYGRYAYGNQPRIALWNLARLAEALLPVVHDDVETAVGLVTKRLHTFMPQYEHRWEREMAAKLGLTEQRPDDGTLFADLTTAMHAGGLDHTQTFRELAAVLRGQTPDPALSEWIVRWHERLADEAHPAEVVAAAMDSVNPVYVPRNHMVDAALSAATDGDLAPFERLLAVVRAPYAERPGLEDYALPAPAELGRFVTYCGT